jgi:Ca2+-binding EF-hand superfamily protein
MARGGNNLRKRPASNLRGGGGVDTHTEPAISSKPSVQPRGVQPAARTNFGTVLVSILVANAVLFVTLSAHAGKSNSAGVLVVFGHPILCVLFEFILAGRLRSALSHCLQASRGRQRPGNTAHGRPRGMSGAPVVLETHDASERITFSGTINDLQSQDESHGGARHAALPRVFDATQPSAAYIEHCASVAAVLHQHLEQSALIQRQSELQQWLMSKYQLRWKKGRGRASRPGDGTPLLTFTAAAKELYILAMRYPSSSAPLGSGPFRWHRQPLRAGGEAAVTRALGSWVDRTASAADSSMFSSTGIWTSPFAVWSFATFAFVEGCIATKNLKSAHIFPLFNVGLWAGVSGAMATAAALSHGHQLRARWCFGLGSGIRAMCYILEGTLQMCKSTPPYDSLHAPANEPHNTRNYPLQFSLNMFGLALFSAFGVGLATHPWATFGVGGIAMPSALVAGSISMALTAFAKYGGTIRINSLTASFLYVLGINLWIGRRRAQKRAGQLAVEDAHRYVELWEHELLPLPGFREELGKLSDVWRTVQAGAAKQSRKQADAAADAALLAQLSVLFSSIDTNHDGAVSRQELLLALRRDGALAEKLQLPAHTKGRKGRARFGRVFEAIDADRSDELSLEEFVAFFHQQQQQQQQQEHELSACATDGAMDSDSESQCVQKLQTAPSLYELMCQADRLNDVFQVKLSALCSVHGGVFHSSPVKTEARALQKVFRTYFGNWRNLCDLVRCSLVFDTLPDIGACLREIGEDAEIEVIAASDDKMRLRESFDAEATSGGYRDIQLAIRLKTSEAKSRGVHEHIVEVQLHLSAVAALKTDGGHANYVLRRNLSGQ